MSIPPHRDVRVYNKFLDCADLKKHSYDYRRPCHGSIAFCDDEFFRRLDVGHPYRDAHFPRYPHADFMFQECPQAVTGQERWGSNICSQLSPMRSSFPTRQNRLEHNSMNMTTGQWHSCVTADSSLGLPVTKPAPESLTHGDPHAILSTRRLRKIERTNGGKKDYHYVKWDRFREGAHPSIPRIVHTGNFRSFGQANIKRSYSDSSFTGSRRNSVGSSDL